MLLASAHKAVLKFCAVLLHGENFKMGMDAQRIERGKWACGECDVTASFVFVSIMCSSMSVEGQ